jgi:hypothetical protein
MKGRIVDLSIGLNQKHRVTLELDGDFLTDYERLKEAEVDVAIKKYRRRRSLDANAYAWVLMDKIAEATGVDKSTVYKEAVRNIGGVSETVCVQEPAAEKLRSVWASNGVGWQSETMPSKIEGCVNVVLYYGSSTYDTKQMSTLIEHLIFEARELDIETMTPNELQSLLDQEKAWKGH